jgi:hypothetical protein
MMKPSSSRTTSSAPASITSISNSSASRPLSAAPSTTNSALRSKMWASEPLVPRLAPHFEKKLRTLATVRVVLLVAASTNTATPPGA